MRAHKCRLRLRGLKIGRILSGGRRKSYPLSYPIVTHFRSARMNNRVNPHYPSSAVDFRENLRSIGPDARANRRTKRRNTFSGNALRQSVPFSPPRTPPVFRFHCRTSMVTKRTRNRHDNPAESLQTCHKPCEWVERSLVVQASMDRSS